MLLNLYIDYISEKNPIRPISVTNANLTLPEVVQDPVLGNYLIQGTMIGALVRVTISRTDVSAPITLDALVIIDDNVVVESLKKDVVMIMLLNDNGEATETLLALLAGKSTIQLSNQNAQGGQNQQ